MKGLVWIKFEDKGCWGWGRRRWYGEKGNIALTSKKEFWFNSTSIYGKWLKIGETDNFCLFCIFCVHTHTHTQRHIFPFITFFYSLHVPLRSLAQEEYTLLRIKTMNGFHIIFFFRFWYKMYQSLYWIVYLNILLWSKENKKTTER